MKLSKKIMLFEEFAQVKSSEVGTAEPTITVDIDQSQIRTEIVNDVDSIINKLEDLATNLETQSTNESEVLNEGMAEQVLSSELYMIPFIIAGGAGAAVAGVGVGIYKLIDHIVKKVKIKKAYKKVHQTKLEAARIDVGLTKLKGMDLDDAQKRKVEALREKSDLLKDNAKATDDKIQERFPSFEKFFAVLRSQSNLEVAEIMLKGELSPSEQKRFQQQLENAEESLAKALEASKEKAKKAEEEAKNKPKAEQIENLKTRKEDLNKKIEETEDDEEKESLQNMVNMIDKQIETLSEPEA